MDTVVIVINGPLGVGKTQTGGASLSRCLARRAAFVDIDCIAAVTPVRPQARARSRGRRVVVV